MIELSDYYLKELAFLRETAAEFAERYPQIASRLSLTERENPDPHVERLLEGAALLAARVHSRLDNDFPEITDALLNIVYPHFLKPVPSMAVAEFALDLQGGPGRVDIRRGSELTLRNAAGITCRFQTCFDLTLWPIQITAAEWKTPGEMLPPVVAPEASHILRLQLDCAPGMTFGALQGLDSLRLHLQGDAGLVHGLYESLLTRCFGILARDPMKPRKPAVRIPGASVTPVGFEDTEASLPYTRHSFAGYRLLQEYFTFPTKFNFLELKNLGSLTQAGFESTVELLLLLKPDRMGDKWLPIVEKVKKGTFRTGCTPVVNVFEHTSDPILLKHTEYEHLLVPDARRRDQLEVFSIGDVRSAATDSDVITPYTPFFSFRHSDTRAQKNAFWYATRRAPELGGPARDVFITFVNRTGEKIYPDTQAITANLLCTNGLLPSSESFAEARTFELKGGGPINSITALGKPSAAIYPATGKAAFWRLISHLSLNHLSLVTEGTDAFRELLELYNHSESAATSAQIQSIHSIDAKPGFARLTSVHGICFARGYNVSMEISEDQFRGAGFFLFASVIERFLAMYATLNSFTKLTVTTPGRREEPYTWPARAGRKLLM